MAQSPSDVKYYHALRNTQTTYVRALEGQAQGHLPLGTLKTQRLDLQHDRQDHGTFAGFLIEVAA